MTAEHLKQVIVFYRHCFEQREIAAISHAQTLTHTDPHASLEHCHAMLDKMIVYVEEGRLEKAFRWLGFIQGILWSQGIFTLSDLRSHNRS